MSKARTIRFDDKLDTMVDEYAEKNGLKVNQLVSIAVEKFITSLNTIELEPVASNRESWRKNMKASFKKHRKAMDELK